MIGVLSVRLGLSNLTYSSAFLHAYQAIRPFTDEEEIKLAINATCRGISVLDFSLMGLLSSKRSNHAYTS
jgi:hypothetical protein